MVNTTSKSTINNAEAVISNTKAVYDENYTMMNNEAEIIVPIDLEGIEGYYISNMGKVFSSKWRLYEGTKTRFKG